MLDVVDGDAGRFLTAEMMWVWHNVLPARRKVQALFVLLLMLIGGLAELLTLGAVVPLLAIFASSGQPQSSSRLNELIARFGLDLQQYPLATVAFVFCAVAVVTAIVRILLSWVTQRYVYGIRYDVGVALYDRMLRQPYSFHVGVNSSRIISCLEHIPRLATGMLLPMFQGLIAVVISAFVLTGLIVLSPWVSLAAVLSFGLIYTGLSLTTGRQLRKNARVISQMGRMRFQSIQEGLGGIADVLLDNSQPVYVRRFAKIDSDLRFAQGANALIGAAPRFVAEAAGIILMVVLAIILYRQEGGAAASLPILGALALGAQRLLPLMQQTYFGWASVQGHRALFFETVTLFRQPVPTPAASEPLPAFKSELVLDSVTFTYAADRDPTLNDVSLTIARGSRVGCVGKSGSGKTTLLNLVMGLLDVSSGEIRVDGIPLKPCNKQSWQRQVAHVPQAIFLLDSSIAENIAFGTPFKDIDHDKMARVCRLAELTDFINTLPEGAMTPVGERGVRLSGGQIQRIGLARALYKDASVLVLDEATSALDDVTEANIIQSVQRLGRDYTVLMIAHRTTTLRGCDLIVRLDEGRLVQSGSPESVFGHAPQSKDGPVPDTRPSQMRKAAGHD